MIKPKIKVLTEKNTESGLAISYADIFSFEFLPDNFKSHDLEGIEESIVKFGFVEPILVNKNTNFDISGNGRLEVLRKMFLETKDCPKGIIEKTLPRGTANNVTWFAPVVLLDISEDDEIVLAAKLNRTNEKGGIDYQKAYSVLMRLKEKNDSSFENTGFDNKALEHIQMLAKFRSQLDEVKANKTQRADSNDAPEPDAPNENICVELNRKWQVSFGDIWQVGKHRLICADSKLPESYAQLLNGAKVRLVFTSPPYDNQRDYELTEKLDWTDLMNNVCQSIFAILEKPADVLINLGIVSEDAQVKFYWNDWLDFCKNELKNPLYGFYVWDKLTGAAGNWNGRLAPAHEFFFHFSIGRESANKWIEKNDTSILRGPKKTDYREKDGSLKPMHSPDSLEYPFKVPDSVIRMQKELTRGIHTEGHPATFPVALPQFLMKTYSMIGDNILEPFLGSGTTMVAGQELERTVYGVEISPNYCALVLERMNKTYPDLEIKKL